MANARLTSNGRTTLPKEIRDKLGLKAKDQLSFTLMPDKSVVIRAVKQPPAKRSIEIKSNVQR